MHESLPQSPIFQAITHSSPTTPAYSSLNTSYDSLHGIKSQNQVTASNDLIERFTNRTSLDLEPYSSPLLVINDSCLDPSKQRQEAEEQANPEVDETKAMPSTAAMNTTSYLGKYRRFRHKYHIS